MKFNYKNRGFVVLSLSLMLIAVGVVNYQLSKDSTLSVSDEFKAYEQAQIDKNSPDDTTLVDSIDGKVTTDDKDKSTETSNSKDNSKVCSTSADQVLVDIIGFLQFLFISTIGAKLQLHPIAAASTPDTLPIS